MKPEEKAQELFLKYYPYMLSYESVDLRNIYAKECALITVYEILDSYTGNLQNGFIDFISYNPIDYWQQVEEQINKL